MGLPGRTRLARILLLPVVLSGLTLAPRAALAGAVDNRGTPPPGSATLPVRGPIPAGAGSFVPGRVLVGFRAGAGERRRRAAAAEVDGRVLAGPGRTRVVQLDRGADVAAAAQRLARRPEVAFAEPDWLRQLDACSASLCWHLRPRPGANVAAAHAAGSSGDGQTVAVVDSGVAYDPDDPSDPSDPFDDFDLGNRVAGRWRCRLTCTPLDPARPDTRTQPQDPADRIGSPHGTEVASVIAAADDGDGITGVAPEATIVSYRVDNAGGAIPSSHLQAALAAIADNDDVDVVNLSLGGSQWSTGDQLAIEELLADGKVVVASAGNEGDRIPRYPAAYPGVISVGATTEDGTVAGFSSFGKVDLAAPGLCVPVAAVAGFNQVAGRIDCGDAPGGVAFNSGTSFSAPIVAGLVALDGGGSPLVARLALEASADDALPGAGEDAKRWAHGLVDAVGFLAARDPGAPPALVLETSGQEGAGGHRFGSGDGQLPHPDTTFVAYAFNTGQDLAGDGVAVTFSEAASGSSALQAVPGEPGVFRASLATGALAPGFQEEQASAPVEGQQRRGSVGVLALELDDQAPGVPLSGAGDAAWQRVDSVDADGDVDDDLDDVYAVTLEAGDRLDVSAVAAETASPVAVWLFAPGTDDVHGQLNQLVACGGGASASCDSEGLHHLAEAAGTYLLDVFPTGLDGPSAYRLTWTVRPAEGLPVTVTVPGCSPNGDGALDRCAWTVGALPGTTATASLVTRSATLVRRQDGAGARSWDGLGETGTAWPDGPYLLRVLYQQPDGRVLLGTFPLGLDRQAPRIADPNAAPDPFEPRPRDGDRDTTTFAITSSEPGRLRVVIYRAATTTVVRVLLTGPQAAGRQRVRWSGRTSSGAWLRGRFSAVLEVVDPAGNRSSSPRHPVRVL